MIAHAPIKTSARSYSRVADLPAAAKWTLHQAAIRVESEFLSRLHVPLRGRWLLLWDCPLCHFLCGTYLACPTRFPREPRFVCPRCAWTSLSPEFALGYFGPESQGFLERT